MSNRLKDEKSPYLLQHADNPVEWYPWCDEAFETAAKRDKPVFLSIGYATCHWCHVMAHESFEDEEVASLLNSSFVNIKVDREERPDIDNTYMTVCQLLTGQGGWPLTVVLTPEKLPFFAATYIPKETRFNRLGMTDLIPRISEAWEKERNKVLHSADQIVTGFKKTLELPEAKPLDNKVIQKGRRELEKRFDREHGGFGTHPKFPSPHNLTFLLQYSYSYNDTAALDMAKLTLEQMRLGGLYDQLGFGFHRYSTDKHWLLPHFEKMLYDQALLLAAYTEAWKHTEDPLFKNTVFEIADYVTEQLRSEKGGFYSAEDADSEGEEGKFYVWELEEIRSIFNDENFRLAEKIFNLKPDGNFRDESTGEKNGKNIPYLKKRIEHLTDEMNLEVKELTRKIEFIRKELKEKRSTRIRPFRDDKILTDWNGLMISSLAKAGTLFENETFIQLAIDAEKFISGNLMEDNKLLHRFRDGGAAIPAMADDYAFLISGLIELYQATFEIMYLEKAVDLNHEFLKNCWDTEKGGVFFTTDKGEMLLGRQKEIYDGAMPSSNSVTAMNLLNLARLTGNTGYEEKAAKLFSAFSSFLDKSPAGATYALSALMRAESTSSEVVICGDPGHHTTSEMLKTIHRTLKQPHVVLLKTAGNSARLAAIAPFTENFPVTSTPAAYICQQFKCEKPVHSAEELRKLVSTRDR